MKKFFTKNWHWIIGISSTVWLLLRTGTNPKRAVYPCQRAAAQASFSWLSSLISFSLIGIFIKKNIRHFRYAIPLMAIFGVFITFNYNAIATYVQKNILLTYDYVDDELYCGDRSLIRLPTWEVENPISKIICIDSVSHNSYSCAAGDSSVPDSHLVDPGIDTLILWLEQKAGIYFYKTFLHPEGIVASNSIVVIKPNFIGPRRTGTNTDRIKGLIWRILQHPNGFTGEIIICENNQMFETLDGNENNSEDTLQSILDVINTFNAKGYPVNGYEWRIIRGETVDEYDQGDFDDGYIYNDVTKITYPKFQTPALGLYCSMRFGIYDDISEAYDEDRLVIIDMPILKDHGWAGATIAVKNWVGLLSNFDTLANGDTVDFVTITGPGVRYGEFVDSMHYKLYWSDYALIARIMDYVYPDLCIVDATWINTLGPIAPGHATECRLLFASTDPVAVSWYAAKFALTPIAERPLFTNPDINNGDSSYGANLPRWCSYLQSAGKPVTMDSSEISVYSRNPKVIGVRK